MLKNTFGHIYVFLAYGIYFCLNFTTEREGVGAVLVRAVEPMGGIETMKRRRNVENVLHLTNGPGKVGQAFGIGMALHGKPVGSSLRVFHGITSPPIERSLRVGIAKARELEWRFFISGNPFVSRKQTVRFSSGHKKLCPPDHPGERQSSSKALQGGSRSLQSAPKPRSEFGRG